MRKYVLPSSWMQLQNSLVVFLGNEGHARNVYQLNKKKKRSITLAYRSGTSFIKTTLSISFKSRSDYTDLVYTLYSKLVLKPYDYHTVIPANFHNFLSLLSNIYLFYYFRLLKKFIIFLYF